MPITLHLPLEMEAELRKENPDLDREAREAIALDLFRREKITHFELGQMLGLNRWETNEFLVDRREFAQSPTLEDLENDFRTITRIMAEHGR
jgi:predicted HTH domain antitoxin